MLSHLSVVLINLPSFPIKYAPSEALCNIVGDVRLIHNALHLPRQQLYVMRK
jgi:hypothetical protein